MLYLHDLTHQLATRKGTRPHVLADRVVPVEVKVALYREGEPVPFAVVDVTGWALHPYEPAKGGQGERAPELVLGCVVPE